MSYIFCSAILKMMLGNIVQHVLLVFTTLAILNSIGIVLSQDELEHGLATDCYYKGMKTYSLFQKFSKFVDKVCCFLDYICGDKCFEDPHKCKCGDTTFTIYDDLYCCIQMNETCKIQGMYAYSRNCLYPKHF